MATFTVVYDACVLHPPSVCDLLLRVAATGLVRARWSDRILDEVIRSIRRVHPEIDEVRLARRRAAVRDAVADAIGDGFEPIEAGLDLPDPGDRHVLAAAIRCGAQAIITANLDDFPAERLAPWNVEAIHPDDFVVQLLDRSEGTVVSVLQQQASALRSPPRTAFEVLDSLERNGLVRSSARIRGLLDR